MINSAMAAYATIVVEDSGPVARVTLNLPDKRNPISPAMCGELLDAFKTVQANVIILTGAGKVFSAGGDLAGMQAQGGAPPATLVELFTTMHDLGKPIIAMVNGHALAGGLGLMVACGLVNRAVPADKLEAATMELANEIAGRSPAAIRLGLRAFYRSQDMEHEPQLRYLQGELGRVLALEDAKEGIAAFLQKRAPVWKGK